MDPRLDRIKTVFDALDTNSNTYLERNDFDALGRRIIKALGVPETSPKAQMVIASSLLYWERLVDVLDRDLDGRLDFEEYAQFHEPATFQSSVRPYAEAVTALSDRDDDGFVEHADFVLCMRAVGFSQSGIDALFGVLDAEGVGRISTVTWTTTIEDFYLNSGRQVAGQALVVS